jgi:hypothetical protein
MGRRKEHGIRSKMPEQAAGAENLRINAGNLI